MTRMLFCVGMHEELVDIADENNELTGEVVSRREAHARGLWHRTAHIYFYRATEHGVELLVHLRSKEKDSSPNKWDTRFGGHLASRQGLLEACVREVREEAGIDISPDDLVDGGWFGKNEPTKHFSYKYFYNFTGDKGDLHFSDGEVQAVKWMTLTDIATALAEHADDWTQKSDSFKKIIAFFKIHLNI